MYADDLVLMDPSSMGLSMLLSVCSAYGIEDDIKYNSAKNGCMSLCNRDILRFMWRVQDKCVLVTRLCDARMRISDHYKGDGHTYGELG